MGATPRIFRLCAALAAALVLFSYLSLQPSSVAPLQHGPPHGHVESFAGSSTRSSPLPARGAELLAISAAHSHGNSPSSIAAAQPSVWHPAAAIVNRPTVANASAPARSFSSVAASKEYGSLATACERPRPDTERQKLLQMMSAALPSDSGGRPGCLEDTTMCQALRHAFSPVKAVPGARRQLVVTAASQAQIGHLASFTEASGALRLPTLVLAMDDVAFEAARGTTAASVLLDSGAPPLARKWAALGEILEAGVAILWADVDAVLAADPFALMYGDSDVEALSEGWDEPMLRGHVMGSDDPSMGWSRYCETMRAALLSPALVYLQPTRPSHALAAQLTRRAMGWRSLVGVAWGDGLDEALALSDELLLPAHDGYARVGTKLRVMRAGCWLHERAALSRLSGSAPSSQRFAALLPGRNADNMVSTETECRQRSAVSHFHRGSPLEACWTSLRVESALPQVWQLERTRVDPFMSHPLRWAETKALVLNSKCKRVTPEAGAAAAATAVVNGAIAASPVGGGGSRALPNAAGATPRTLNLLVSSTSAEWPTNCREQPQLCEVVKRVHRDRAVMAAVCNRNILGMLGRFVDTVQSAGVTNFLVVAIDQATSDFLTKRSVANYVRPLRTRSGSTDNHATSGLKFQILSELLSVGVSVLLTDVDVVLTQDPFPALYRDSDVEGMSDGWDEDSGYGHVHELPLSLARDASAPAAASTPLRSVRMAARNSGLFYLSATHESLRLMQILAKRMASEDVWDQSAYNMEIFRPAYGQYVAAGVSVRAMNFVCFCNTKVLFKYMRHDPQLIDPARHVPVTVHINCACSRSFAPPDTAAAATADNCTCTCSLTTAIASCLSCRCLCRLQITQRRRPAWTRSPVSTSNTIPRRSTSGMGAKACAQEAAAAKSA